MAAKTSNLNGTEERPNRRERRERNEGGAREKEKSQFIERVVFINRVAKVVKGGRRFSFSAIVVLGDGQGAVGQGASHAETAQHGGSEVAGVAERVTRVVHVQDAAVGIAVHRGHDPDVLGHGAGDAAGSRQAQQHA